MYLDVIMLHSDILSFILQVKSFTVPQDISQWIKMLNRAKSYPSGYKVIIIITCLDSLAHCSQNKLFLIIDN
jgi:hypothetical protein